jgi:hypothetical protein
VAAVCVPCYIIAGFTIGLGFATSVLITLPVAIALLMLLLFILPKVVKVKGQA